MSNLKSIGEMTEVTEDTTNNKKAPPPASKYEPHPISDVESFCEDVASFYEEPSPTKTSKSPTKTSKSPTKTSKSPTKTSTSPTKTGKSLMMSIDGDSLEKSLRVPIDSDTLEKGLTVSIDSDTLEKSIRVSIDSDTLERISSMEDMDDDFDDDDSNVREAYLCCFCCCDLVRACIVMNSIACVIWVIISSLVIYEVPTLHWLGVAKYLNDEHDHDDDYGYPNSYSTDDYFHYEFTDANPVRRHIVSLVRMGCAILFSAIGAYGAAKFHQPTVLCTAIWYCVYIVWSGLDQAYSGPVVGILLAYPNWHLFFELGRGSISREYYWREKHCCGCDERTTTTLNLSAEV